jgi:UDP-glucose 4-epimerase
MTQRPMDIPIYITDNRKITRFCGWKPEIPLRKTLQDTFQNIISQS